jgi:hypothetical protein
MSQTFDSESPAITHHLHVLEAYAHSHSHSFIPSFLDLRCSFCVPAIICVPAIHCLE